MQDAPVSIAFNIASRHFKQTVRAIVCDYLFSYASWTTDLVALDAVEEVFERVQAKVGARGSWVKGSFIVFGLWLYWRGRIVVTVTGDVRRIGARAEYVRVWIHGSHFRLW